MEMNSSKHNALTDVNNYPLDFFSVLVPIVNCKSKSNCSYCSQTVVNDLFCANATTHF